MNSLFTRFVPLSLLFVFSFSPAASLTGLLQGDIQDRRTHRPVDFARIRIESQMLRDSAWILQSDSLGHFAGQFPTGPVDLVVSASGYETLHLPDIEIRNGLNPSMTIQMVDLSVRTLETTVITAPRLLRRDPLQSTSVSHLSKDQVNNSPGSSQDVNRVLTSLPAVTASADNNWNSFLVRGGDTHENLFLLDGIELANISHWGDEYTNGGAVGMLHLDFVRDLDFYAGGMPASLPPRLSSVTDIRLREGDFKTRRWQLDLNMAGAGGFAEGPIEQNQSSYMVSGRVSFLTIVSKMLPFSGVPEYRNSQAKIVSKWGEWGKVSWNFLGGDESIRMDDGREGVTVADGKHAVGGMEWQIGGETWSNKLLVSGLYTEYGARQNSGELELFDFKTHKTRIQLKDHFDWYVRKNDIASFGFVGEGVLWDERIRRQTFYQILDEDGVLYAQELPGNYPDSLWRDTLGGNGDFADTLGYRVGAFSSYLWNMAPWTLSVGIRNDYYTLLRANGLSPRLSVTRDFASDQSLSLSGSMIQQFPETETLMDLEDFAKGIRLQDVPLQRNWGGALGYKKQIGKSLAFDAEVYGKYYDRERNYHLDPDSGERICSIDPKNHWHRKTAGLELHLQKQRQDRFFYEVAYSFSWAEQEYDNGKWYTADDNLRNSCHVILGSRFLKHHAVSSRMDLSEGRPYTPIDTARSLREYRTTYQMGNGWNTKRRDFSMNLSLRYSHTSEFQWGRMESYVEGTNLLNRADIISESYDLGKGPEDGAISASQGRGIFVVGGLLVSF